MDMIISDESPSEISDKIKELIQAKSVEKINLSKPYIANTLFNQDQE